MLVRIWDGVLRVNVESELGVAAPAAKVGREVDYRVFGAFVRSVARFRRKIGADEHDDGRGVFLRGRGADFERRVALYRVYDDVVWIVLLRIFAVVLD